MPDSRGWLIIIILSVAACSFGYKRAADNCFEEPVAGYVESKYLATRGGETRYRVVVVSPSGAKETLEVRDSFLGGFRSADDWAKVPEAGPLRGKAYGWRSGLFSQFRRLKPE